MIALTSSTLAIVFLSLALPSLGAPIDQQWVRQVTRDDILEPPTLLGESSSIPTSTRSSKYAIDYLPSAVPNSAIPVAEVVPTTTRSSKYAIDHIPTWAVRPPGPNAVNDMDEEISSPKPTLTADYLPTVEATTSLSSSTTRATSIRPSKYAIDYLPTRVQPPPQATHA
ncbi:hypothetical protein ONZ45_g11486 [Pleurotus djamor]|nr:hypothetical protein ONZ45_g11486 [Pleurotus djamor]